MLPRMRVSPLFATPSEGSYCNVAMAYRSDQFPLGLDHIVIEDSSLEEAKARGASHVIICTPSKAGGLTAFVITGPAVGELLKEKMDRDPSHRPTAKCCASSQAVSCAIVYVTPSAVMGNALGATLPGGRRLTPCAARCSRERMTDGIGFEGFMIKQAASLPSDCFLIIPNFVKF